MRPGPTLEDGRKHGGEPTPWRGGAFGTAAQGRARAPRAPTEVCEAGASSVVLAPQ